MDAQQFLAEFAHIASAPEGVQRILKMIYNLAITGNLTEQRSEDGNAQTLLEDIKREKLKRIQARNFKKLAKLESEPVNVPANIMLPDSWRWTRLLDIGEISPRNEAEDSAPAAFIPMSGIPQPHKGKLESELRSWGDIKKGFTHFANGDVVVAKITPCFENGKAAVISGLDNELGIGAGTTELHVFRPIHPEIHPGYIYFFLRSPFFTVEGEQNMTGTAGQKRLPTEYFATRALPLPPFPEQTRIVAKVDALMALCDKLQAQQQECQELSSFSFDVVFGSLANSESPGDLYKNWRRLADNSSLLLGTPDTVTALRQAVRLLAVRGLLVSQNDHDEPARELLNRVRHEKEKLIAEGKIKRSKPLPTITEGDKPYDLPEGWEWARFPELGEFARGKSKHRPRNDPRLFNPGVHPLVQTGEVARANHVIKEYHSKYSELGLAQSRLWPKGTLCITIAANIANVAILGFDACFPDSVVGFIPGSEIVDKVDYFLTFMETAQAQLLAFAPSTAQKNINLEILESVLVPVPPLREMNRIIKTVNRIMILCDKLELHLMTAQKTGKLMADAAVAAITGIRTEEEEELKAPKTELISRLRIGSPPTTKDLAPLAGILVRYNGEMQAKDLWQRYGGEIDAFYRQLKVEVGNGWILEPEVAEIRTLEAS